MKRVFVSSVIRGFEDRREAARRAIQLLDQHPVMAEDFGAKSYSPQTACLDHISRSDIYVGVFGQRYGDRVASGLSPTEEEFNEARGRGLAMLCFIEEGTKDADQQDFLGRIKQYEQGLNIGRFRNPEELKDGIVKALNNVLGQPGVGELDVAAAAEQFQRRDLTSRRFSFAQHSEVALGLIVIPKWYGPEYFSLRKLANRETKDEFLQAAAFGNTRLFEVKHGIHSRDGDDCAEFWVGDLQNAKATLSVHSDGALKFSARLGKEERVYSPSSFIRGSVIDRSEVAEHLVGFARYADWAYSQLQEGQLLSAFFIGASLTHIGHKQFGDIPNPAPNSISGMTQGIDDPLIIPSKPKEISRLQLRDGEEVANDLTELMHRAFRKHGGAYEPHATGF